MERGTILKTSMTVSAFLFSRFYMTDVYDNSGIALSQTFYVYGTALTF